MKTRKETNIKYWEGMYGKRSKDFIDGVIAGVEAFAAWKDKKQVVGCLREPLKEVIADIREQLG